MLPLPSIDTFRACIRHCRLRLLPLHACGLHCCILKHGLLVHTLLANNLVLFLAESGNVCSAQQLFESLSCKDESCWAPLIDGYISCSMPGHALRLYKKMPLGSPHLDSYMIVSLLKSCAELKDVETGSIIHFQVAQSQLFECSVYVDTALVDMYAKCGALPEARYLFLSLSAPNTVTWNALLAGHVLHGHCKEATELFDYMQAQHVLPDAFTYTCILKACATLRDSDKGSTINDCISKSNMLHTNQFLGNALVNMYSKCGLHAKAKEVLLMLPIQSVVSWNGLIAGCMQHNCFEEVLSCIEQMQLAGIPLNDATYACALKACGSLAAIDKGRELHAEIKRDGVLEQNLVVGTALVDMYAKCGMLADAQEAFKKLPVRDVVAWSALIDGYTHSLQAEEAVNCFGLMKIEGVSPNVYTYACCLKACGILGAIEKGERIHVDIEEEGVLQTDQVVGNALVDMYTKCGALSKAWEVFKQLPVKNVITWTSIITGCAQLGETASVFNLLERMRGEGIMPNGVTFLAALYACSHAGLVNSGHSLFEAMTQQYGVVPTLDHLTCVMDLLSRAGQFNAATKIITETPSHLDTAACLAMLGSCKTWQNAKLGRLSFDLAMQLKERETAAYLCMHNIYSGGVVYA